MAVELDKKFFYNWIRKLVDQFIQDYRGIETPITRKLIVIIAVIFGLQWFLALIGGGSVHNATAWLFLTYPISSWALAFFLHKGVLHLLGNFAIIGLLGKVVEPKFTRKKYWTFILGTGYISTAVYGIITAKWSIKPVAVYGASGAAFALAAYFLFSLIFDQDTSSILLTKNQSPLQAVAEIIAVSSLFTVLVDPFTGAPFTSDWINFAHLTGFGLGLLVSYFDYQRL